ncbi:MAG: aminotransferase [Gammaproteobacteria bacterium]|nr:aminotransferase [Gammaproteobacteria bacterium]|tara:strand:+ start:601 stop:1893 length:1293 start_codon:yes stop_codon:yes gene_type:complete
MTAFDKMGPLEVKDLHTKLSEEYEAEKIKGLSLDLSRGKPASDQLELSSGLDDMIGGNYIAMDGTDVRNYGQLRGIEEARVLGAKLIGCSPEEVICWNNSSLSLMNIVLNLAQNRGLWGDNRKWSLSKNQKILAPVPGYDRHFTLTERAGIKMISVPMENSGPDTNKILELVSQDPEVKGIWCVPKFSNPTGCTYTPACVKFMAELPKIAAANDFIVMWDNAYAVHDLAFPMENLTEIMAIAKKIKTDEHIISFASTSKITYPSGGIAFIASGPLVLEEVTQYLSTLSIGPDKVNQLRHARFLNGRLEAHMKKHAKLLNPKFELVQKILKDELEPLGIAEWTSPSGGYFISVNAISGTAQRVGELSSEAGLNITPPGATFPYGIDPRDSNLRIAPTYAGLDELNSGLKLLSLCIKIAALETKLKRANQLE